LKSRQSALVKDLARLLTKYSARDWQPLVRLLTSDPKLLFEAISSKASNSPKLQKVRKKVTDNSSAKRRATVKTKKALAKKSSKAGVTKSIRHDRSSLKAQSDAEELAYRRVLARASVSDLQALYLRAYNNKQIPKSRTELTAALDKYLKNLSQHERTQLLMSSSHTESDPTETYRRWVDIISKSTRDTNS